jgi:hypothetical protein
MSPSTNAFCRVPRLVNRCAPKHSSCVVKNRLRDKTTIAVATFIFSCLLTALAAAQSPPPNKAGDGIAGPPNGVAAPPAASKPAIENLRKVSPRLWSGGEPHDDAAFSKLAELGVRVLVSVDGAKPNVAAAKKHGLRYVHIPIGYDGVDAHAQAALTRVVREAKGPVFIHCHHGKHRGPAAAAVMCLAAGDMNHAEAAKMMKEIGTGKEYTGLWRDVAAFKPLPADAKLPELVEVAEVGSLAAAMSQLGRAWDGLKLCQAAGWKTPKDHADLAPKHQALLVLEGFKESRRNLEYDDPQMAKRLEEAIVQAEQLHQSLQAGRTADATAPYKALEAACLRCHEQYRN